MPDNETREDVLEETEVKNTEANEDLPSVVSLNAENEAENEADNKDTDTVTESAIEQAESEPEDNLNEQPEQDSPLEQGDIEPSNIIDENELSYTPRESDEQPSEAEPLEEQQEAAAEPEQNSPLEQGITELSNNNTESDSEEAQASSEDNLNEQPEQNSPFGASAPSEASQRGLDFEGDLKMGVLESPETESDSKKTSEEDSSKEPETAAESADVEGEERQSDDGTDEQSDGEDAPELVLEDLDEYRDAANIEEPEQLVDINEFLEMKRKADAAKKEQEGKKKKKKKKEDIFVNRYKAKTINAAVAAAEPIIYFYNAALDKSGKIRYFNVYQVLQDRFMGKVIPQQFTSVAEGSAKIEELNIANIITQCKLCNEYPQYEFVVSVSTRFFTRPNILEKLRKELKAEKHNLVLAFDCVSLQNIGTAAKTGLSILRLAGAKIMLDNTEAVSMTSLTELEYDYIRIDARYFEKGAERPLVYLELLSRFAASQGIITSASFCDEAYLGEYMLSRGITAVQGDAVSRPMRTVPNAVKAVTLLPSMID